MAKVRKDLNVIGLPVFYWTDSVSDTYVVSDPCINTQHEFGTNSARTQHELSTNLAQKKLTTWTNVAAFIGSRKEDYWLIQTDQ